MKITLTLPTNFGYFGYFRIVTDLQLAIKKAVEEHRETGKAVEVVYCEHHNVTVEVFDEMDVDVPDIALGAIDIPPDPHPELRAPMSEHANFCPNCREYEMREMLPVGSGKFSCSNCYHEYEI